MIGYRIARASYLRFFNREYWEHRRQRCALYSRFVRPGDLVFDVGANVGNVSEVFIGLGARVVAIEPSPNLAREIRRRCGRRVTVETVALGAEPGHAPLLIGKHSGHSTLSAEWAHAAPTADRWAGTIEVPVTTLDLLFQRYGLPAFVKIDVEGYEDKVLAGLTLAVPALSFEFQAAYLTPATACLDRLSGAYEFVVLRSSTTVLPDEWERADLTRDRLGAICRENPTAYGDVFARHRSSAPTSHADPLGRASLS